MSLTALVKAELSRLEVTRPSERKAEVAALLRCAGAVHLTGGRVVIEAELDTGAGARRLRRDLAEVYGYTSGVSVLDGGNPRRGVRYLIRIARHGEGLARQTGLVDTRGRPIRGLPPAIVSGNPDELAAAWRGAFLARGTLTDPGRTTSLEIACPTPETAIALIGAARRLAVPAKAREVHDTHHVLVRDTLTTPDAIPALLTRMGAPQAALAWTEQRLRREVRATANRVANFDNANAHRATQAAAAATARVHRGLQILGGDAPAHLLAAGHLRLHYRDASLTELGQRAEPPMTKDAIAGHLRRLLALADQVAATLGIPDTKTTPDP